jgi:dipeptidase E
MSQLLLLSSSQRDDLGCLEHAGEQFARLLDGRRVNFLLIPYASISRPYDALEAAVVAAFASFGLTVTGIHHHADPVRAVREAEGIAVAGGNTFALLKRIYDNSLFEPIRARVAAGVPYLGWSAGANIACPTIRTTNDMPIVMPPAINGFGFVPFHINPHFVTGTPQGHHLQEREDKLREFVLMNPGEAVVALPEGTALLCEDNECEVLGDRGALHFTAAGIENWREGHRFSLLRYNSG